MTVTETRESSLPNSLVSAMSDVQMQWGLTGDHMVGGTESSSRCRLGVGTPDSEHGLAQPWCVE